VTVRFLIPGPLTPMTGGRGAVDVDSAGSTLADALQALFAAYPGLRDRVATEQRELRQHVNVFVGNEDSRFTGGLATPLFDGAEISIIPSIGGGY
jgi:sulfur-carrier protein